MKEAYKVAIKKSNQGSTKVKEHFDFHIRGSMLYSGDRVPLQNFIQRERPVKLQSHCENRSM